VLPDTDGELGRVLDDVQEALLVADVALEGGETCAGPVPWDVRG
jgi:hypothetical protein